MYVDGPIPPSTNSPEPGWVTAVGLHPTKVSGVTTQVIESLVTECAHRGWVVGEVGLDFCRGSGWGHQRWVLWEICLLVTPLTLWCFTCGVQPRTLWVGSH